jgi:ADP-heptose:LPS heptosyltransferase
MQQSPNVLVVRRRYLGDIVLLGSFFRNLKLHWPEARVRILVEPAYAGVVPLNLDLESAFVTPRRPARWPGFLLRLRQERFTHVFNFDNTEGTALITRATGAAFRCGVHHGGYLLRFRWCYTHTVNHPNEEHESHPITEYYLEALSAAGVPLATREVRLTPREEDVAEMRRIVGATGPVLLVHPGSRSTFRIWPPEQFAAVCDRAQDELGAQAVLVGGPGDRQIVDEIRRAARTHLLNPTESLSVPRFAALARLAAVVLCHDSGPMHIAAAVGTPVVALYGSQNTTLFRPVGEGHSLIQAPLPCTDCVAPDTCVPKDSYRNYCVRRISTDQVYAAVRAQLSRVSAARA